MRIGGVRAILVADASWRPSLVETDEWIDGATGELCHGSDRPSAQRSLAYPRLWRESTIWVWDAKKERVEEYAPGMLC